MEKIITIFLTANMLPILGLKFSSSEKVLSCLSETVLSRLSKFYNGKFRTRNICIYTKKYCSLMSGSEGERYNHVCLNVVLQH